MYLGLEDEVEPDTPLVSGGHIRVSLVQENEVEPDTTLEPGGHIRVYLGQEDEVKPNTPLVPGRHTRMFLGQEDEVHVKDIRKIRLWLNRRAANAPAPTSGGVDARVNNCIIV